MHAGKTPIHAKINKYIYFLSGFINCIGFYSWLTLLDIRRKVSSILFANFKGKQDISALLLGLNLLW